MERQRGDLELNMLRRGKPSISCGLPSSLNTTSVTPKGSMSSTNWSFLFVADELRAPASSKACWRRPGQLEAPKLVGAGLVASSCRDEPMDVLLMEGRAENRDGSARLEQSWEGAWFSYPQPLQGAWQAKNLSLAQQRRRVVSHLCPLLPRHGHPRRPSGELQGYRTPHL